MSTNKVTRRSFLKTGCLVTAALGVTVVGGVAIAASDAPKIEQPASTYGKTDAASRLLVAYASQCGSTAEVALRIGEGLAKRGLSADVKPVDQVADLASYQTVVLGSAIRAGKVLPAAQKFVEANQAALQAKHFSLFILCMTLATDTPETRATVSAYLDPLRAVLKPANEALFAGVMDPNKLSTLERLLFSAKQAPVGDFRKWDQINAWAQAI
jgi:menaquinone-dependent protoporphyrinogen oxidase